MKYLFDTHTFVWIVSLPLKLFPTAAGIIQNLNNTLLLSLASIWEIQIKLQLGKLTLPAPLPAAVQQQQANGLQLLPISPQHIYQIGNLPAYHRDPFDRVLIAQAMVENAVFMTDDVQIAKYPVQIIC